MLVWYTIKRILRRTAARLVFCVAPVACIFLCLIFPSAKSIRTALTMCSYGGIGIAFVAVWLLAFFDNATGLDRVIKTYGVSFRQLLGVRFLSALSLSLLWVLVGLLSNN